MKIILTFALMVLFAGCQSMPDKQTGVAQNLVFLSAQHCLNEYLDDLEKVHYGPCLKVIEVDGEPPTPGPDGFIRLPVAAPLTINTSCVYRHADGTPIPATVETATFTVTPQTFTEPGVRWYLHANTRARGVVGCQPTLSRSTYPTYETD